MKDYNKAEKTAKSKSRVYKGIRYYIYGEIYFCNEYDEACEFSFVRVQPEEVKQNVKVIKPAHVEKYIDDNLEDLLISSKELVLETINSEMEEILIQQEELERRMIHLSTIQSDILYQRIDYHFYYDN